MLKIIKNILKKYSHLFIFVNYIRIQVLKNLKFIKL